MAFSRIQINQVLDTSFLGVIIEQNITWKPQINYMATKISKSIGVLYKSSFFLPQNILISLCINLSLSALLQCCLGLHLLLQKRCVRIITKADFCAPSDPILKELSILTISKVNSLQKVCFMYSYSNNLLPSCFDNFFLSGDQIHHYNTRNANKFRTNTFRTRMNKFSIKYQGPLFWNSLDTKLTHLPLNQS